MGMPEATARYTAEMVQALPQDGNRYEVVHGELLVTPAPAPLHQAVLRRLMRALEGYLEPLGRGETVFPAPADISWDDDTLVQPDISVVAPEDERPAIVRDTLRWWVEPEAPELLVELAELFRPLG